MHSPMAVRRSVDSSLAFRRKTVFPLIDIPPAETAADSASVPSTWLRPVSFGSTNHGRNLWEEFHHLDSFAQAPARVQEVKGTWMIEDKLVATAGPMFKTSTRYLWDMVARSSVQRVINLCEPDECVEYLPEDGATLHVDKSGLAVSRLPPGEQLHGSDLKRTVLQLRDTQGKTRRVDHVSFMVWPDRDTPPKTAVRSLQHLVEEVCDDEAPTLVHCRGGLGRTGVFVALCVLVAQMREQVKSAPTRPPRISVVQALLDIRSRCPGMVQTPKQYEFIYEALAAWVQSKDLCETKGRRSDTCGSISTCCDSDTESCPDLMDAD